MLSVWQPGEAHRWVKHLYMACILFSGVLERVTCCHTMAFIQSQQTEWLADQTGKGDGEFQSISQLFQISKPLYWFLRVHLHMVPSHSVLARNCWPGFVIMLVVDGVIAFCHSEGSHICGSFTFTGCRLHGMQEYRHTVLQFQALKQYDYALTYHQ